MAKETVLSTHVDRDQVKTGRFEGFLPVHVSMLAGQKQLELDLYHWVRGRPVLLCGKGNELTGKAFNLIQGGKFDVYVPVEQGPALSHFAEQVLNSLVKDPSVSVVKRAEILEGSARAIMADVLVDPAARGIVRRSRRLVKIIRNFMQDVPEALNMLTSLFQRDYYTFTHCVHVCMLAVGLFRHMVSTQRDLVEQFALGTLLHDVGKTTVDQELLNKPSRLTAEEFETIKAHAVNGWELLKTHGLSEADYVLRDAVLYHHEKLDGSGYPEGLSAEKLSNISRITAIVDVYDALTTNRPYRKAMTHEEACTVIQNQMIPRELDAEVFHVFQRMARPMCPAAHETQDDLAERGFGA